MSQDYPHEIIMVDNASSDQTVDYVRAHYPSVTIVETGADFGYGKGNNIGATHTKGKYIVILNPDTIVHENWLSELIKPIRKNENIITTSKILMWNGKTINTCGNSIHFSGLAFTTGLGDRSEDHLVAKKVSAISGASFALTKEAYMNMGGFDEHFFMYHEDAELSWRAGTLGYIIQTAPQSILRHDYVLKVSPNKIYQLEKGRYYILRKYYTPKILLKIFPSLFITEILAFGYAIKLGKAGIIQKIHAIHDGWSEDVNPVYEDKSLLSPILDNEIPINQLTKNSMERSMIRFANMIFLWNSKYLN